MQTGNNPDMIRALGVNTSWMKIIALLFSNGLVALSGALITQYQQNASVTNGTGMIVVGLASVIIGEVIFGNRFNFIYKLSSVVIGSLIYRIVVALVLSSWSGYTRFKTLYSSICCFGIGCSCIQTTNSAFIKQNR